MKSITVRDRSFVVSMGAQEMACEPRKVVAGNVRLSCDDYYNREYKPVVKTAEENFAKAFGEYAHTPQVGIAGRARREFER